MSASKDELPVVSGTRVSASMESSPKNRRDEIRLALMGIAALVSYLGLLRSITPIDVVAIGASLIGGYPVFVETFHALRHRSINMEVSMTVAIVASLLVAQFTADVVIVRDGERIPVDGVIVRGSGFVNQSAITGEALAVEKTNGSRVFAGSVDESGVLEVQTEKVGSETVFGQIIKLVEEAESRKAPIQKLSDKLATWLVEFTIAFAVITFIVTRNLISTISVIVVAGACGVAAGTPLAIVAAMGGLAKKGVIVKGGVYIQEMSKIDTVVIDKTGTLTLGDPEVTDVVGLDGCSQKQVLTYAAAAEKLSNHPLARAITAKAQELGANPTGSLSSDYLAGKGIMSWYEGERVLVGNSVLMTEQNIPISEDAQAIITSKISEGKTTVIVAHGGHTCGVIGVSDKIRNESRTAVQELGKMGISTIMLTGDNKFAANRVGEQAGIKQVYAELLPPDKVSIIERLSAMGQKIGLALAFDGILNPLFAAGIHVVSELVFILNSARLIR